MQKPPQLKSDDEPLDLILQGFYYSSLLLIIFIAVMCLLFEVIDIILT
ncbi:hypothetical protein [Corynebacterium glutamicum]|nr:hypothetical protein [Corynebacterium glutamicum]GFK19299.1 hypothetical protein KbCgl_18710 [Corynebacterium glutamicum]